MDHVATVQVISKAHENISKLLTELDTPLFPADVRMEAVGEKVRPLLDLTGTKLLDAEFVLARQFLCTQMEASMRAEDDKWTMKTLCTTFHKTLEAIPSVMVAFKSALTFGASTATGKKLLFCFEEHFQLSQAEYAACTQSRLIQLSFEKDLKIIKNAGRSGRTVFWGGSIPQGNGVSSFNSINQRVNYFHND